MSSVVAISSLVAPTLAKHNLTVKDVDHDLETYFALAKAGLVVVAINARFKAGEVSHYLNDSGARALIVSEDLAYLGREALEQAAGVRYVVGIGEGHGFGLDFEELVAASSSEEPDRLVDEEDLFVLAYSSGTTGQPKGAMITQRNTVSTVITTAHEFRLLPHHRLASVGRAHVGNRVRVVSPDGRPASRGEMGEVVIKGPGVMRGYWHDPDGTAEALRDGWLYPGDLGTMDEDGFVYLKDRRKDMIVSGGINVYPREVEEVLYGHPAILEAAVIGVPDDRWGETVKAVVALRPGHSATGEELIAYCKERLASYKKPTSVDIVDSLPKTSSNKIWKLPLRERYWMSQDRTLRGI